MFTTDSRLAAERGLAFAHSLYAPIHDEAACNQACPTSVLSIALPASVAHFLIASGVIAFTHSMRAVPIISPIPPAICPPV